MESTINIRVALEIGLMACNAADACPILLAGPGYFHGALGQLLRPGRESQPRMVQRRLLPASQKSSFRHGRGEGGVLLKSPVRSSRFTGELLLSRENTTKHRAEFVRKSTLVELLSAKPGVLTVCA